MRRLTLAGIGIIAAAIAALPAAAADMPMKAPVYRGGPVVSYNWTGFYVGGHLGGAWGQTDYFTNIAGPNTTNADPDGFIGGGQVGFNYQVGAWVFGVEGDWSWTNLRGSGPEPTSPPAGGILKSDANWFATAAGRFGYASGRWLLYVKGGAAWMNVDHAFSNIGPPAFTASATKTHSGWTVGTGLEWAFADTWSAKFEYNYLDFGNDSVVLTGGPVPITVGVDQQVHAVKLGLNYRWGSGPLVARY